LSESLLIPREFIKISNKYIGLCVKHPLFLSDFNELNFLDIFSKNRKMSDFMIICPVGAELFHVDRWTDMMKLIVAFCNVANVPKKHETVQKICL